MFCRVLRVPADVGDHERPDAGDRLARGVDHFGRLDGERLARRRDELGARGVAVVGRLRQRLLDDLVDRVGKVGA
jgi:hypothetical protein